MMKMMKFLFVVLLVGTATGCSIFQPPVVPPPAGHFYLKGKVIDDKTGAPIAGALVVFGDESTTTAGKGKYQFLDIMEVHNQQFKVISDRYTPYVTRIDLIKDTILNVRLTKDEPDWDFSKTKLRGWCDPVSGAYYYDEKFAAVLADCAVNGSNCTAIVADRSWGEQFHDGNCHARGTGWWSHIVDDGWEPQFGDSFESCFENIHKSSEVNVDWLNLMERRVKMARDEGLWIIITIWNPYDDKGYGVDWYFWTPDCQLSPYINGNRYYTEWQRIATLALVERLCTYENVIWCDNWENCGYPGSVNLEWKKLVYQWVRSVDPNSPYFVYLDSYHSNYEATVQWINNTPDIAGLHSHYISGKDRSDFGLSENKRLLNTEEYGLSLESAYNGLRWADSKNADVCMYAGEYRNFMRTDGGEDDGKPAREHWYPIIREYFGIN